jgi:hypothetical protein
MKYSSSLKTAAAVLSLAFLASCGGGDDAEAGGPVDFNVFPTEFGLLAPAGGTCDQVDNAVKVFVNGGAGPYTILNPHPELIGTSTNKVEKPGDSFTVSFLGGCTQDTGVGVLVKDALDRQVTLTLKFTVAAT